MAYYLGLASLHNGGAIKQGRSATRRFKTTRGIQKEKGGERIGIGDGDGDSDAGGGRGACVSCETTTNNSKGGRRT